MTYPQAQTGQTPTLTAAPRFPDLEREVLAYWQEHQTFFKSVDQREAGINGDNEYVFYDGPPFANGLPHYGHLLTGYVKDVVPRYQSMRGRRVERRFGWDTHGLPAELEAMSQLGIKTKEEIVDLGIEAFNAKCRESVLKYTDEWRDYVTRQARWVDFDNDYKTLNPDYMESVIWAFKQLYDKGLVYEGFRVLPYCWNDQTPLSNHELRMDEDVYQVRQDPAVTVGFRVRSEGELDGALLLIWTTTPWTLPANLAIMVDPEIDYVVVEGQTSRDAQDAGDPTPLPPERYVIAQARLSAYERELGADAEARIVQRLKGSDLIGLPYVPPFSYYEGHAKSHVVTGADFVTTTDGTGLVHSAGAFGEEDKEVTDRMGIEPVMPVGPDGAFQAPVDDYAGMLVFDANAHIIDHLKAATRGSRTREAIGAVTPGTVLLRHETYDHSYPHCWRCRQPLIYKAVSSWFVAVTQFKERMVELNDSITWVPEHIKDGQFGKWLSNARDWSISRNRFWGSPIPVWRSDDPAYPRLDVYGSFAELEADFGDLPRDGNATVDLHRPFVDQLTRPNPDDPTGRSTMRRVEDVLDVWFDSGAMSFAQVHYPFDSTEWFEHHFPADFIVEYIGQTRGWFYTLHILATALFDRPAFSTCISHGIVLGSDGQKMSKSLGNYPDVREVFDRDGADAMRWFLMSSPILRGGNLVVTEQGIRDEVRQVLLPLWNAWYFFGLYANAAGAADGAASAAGAAGADLQAADHPGRGGDTAYQARWSTDSQHRLDRYLLAKTRDLVSAVQGELDASDIAGACASVRGYVDVLTNWYVRRSRSRFWGSAAESRDTAAAFDTLYTALEVVCRVAAPLLPLMTEQVWRGLTGGESVHLTDWPQVEDLPADAELVATMDLAREVCSTTSALRQSHQLRTRLPLSRLTVVLDSPAAVEGLTDVIRDEVNVREVVVLAVDDPAADAFGVEQRLTVNARAAGPRLGREVQHAIKGSKSGDWTVSEDGVVTAGGLELLAGEYVLETVVSSAVAVASESVTTGSPPARATATLPSGGFVALSTEVTQDLAREGLARDLIRAVQQSRREAELNVSDRISLTVVGDDDVWQAAVEHQSLVMAETLAVQFGAAGAQTPLPGGGAGIASHARLDGDRAVQMLISKVDQ